MQITVKDLIRKLTDLNPNDVIQIANNEIVIVTQTKLFSDDFTVVSKPTPAPVKIPDVKPSDLINTQAKRTRPRRSDRLYNQRRGWELDDLLAIWKLHLNGAEQSSIASLFGRTEKAVSMQLSNIRTGKYPELNVDTTAVPRTAPVSTELGAMAQ